MLGGISYRSPAVRDGRHRPLPSISELAALAPWWKLSAAMSKRVFNFSAGPAMLPLEVLEASAKALVDYQGTGFGIAEVSHRGKEFDGVLAEALALVKKLLNVPASHDILVGEDARTQLFVA